MHGLRLVVLPLSVLFLLAAVSNGAQAADDTRVLFRFDQAFDLTRIEASDTQVTLKAPALRLETGHGTTWPGIRLTSPSPKSHWDLSSFRTLAIDVQNVGDRPVNIHVRIDDQQSEATQRWITGQIDLKPGERKTARIRLKRKMPDALREQLFGMRGYPGGWDRDHGIDVTQVVRLILFINNPATNHAFTIANVRACGQVEKSPALNAEKLFPLVDRYGQFRHRQWPGKVHRDSDLERNRHNEAAALEAHPGPGDWNQYGGWLAGPRLEATGRFRTQKHQGKWSLVDPEGRLFWSHGSDCVGWSSGFTPITDRQHWFAALPAKDSPDGTFYGTATWAPHGYYHDKGRYETYSFACLNLMRKYGNDWKPTFAALAHRRLRSWGMNTIANWSNRDIYALRKTPYTVSVWFTSKVLGGSKGYWGKFPDPFDPSFAAALDATMVSLGKTEVGDPWCLGYFVSNELGWGDEFSLAQGVLASPAEQAAKQTFVADLKMKYVTIERLNAAWQTEHASWDALCAAQTPPDKNKAHDDLAAFYTKIAEAYFRGCRDAIRRADPQGLYLGCRFSAVNQRAARAAAKYCDIVSYNRYERSVGGLRLPAGCDRPILIGEFHFGALDRGMLHTGLVETSDQAARATAYRNYVHSALANPAIVGTHWFQFCDQAVTGRGDGENYQIGLLDVCDTPYAETIEACREIGAEMYRRRWELRSTHRPSHRHGDPPRN